MNLYELTQEFATAMQAITVDPETGEVSGFEAVDGLDAAFEEKAEAYAVTIKNLDAEVKALKNERDNLKAREDATKKRMEYMKQHLADSMLAVGKDKISTSKAALSFRKSMQVNITSDVMVPDDLCKVVIDRKPDKAAIGKLLKAGETVPGRGTRRKHEFAGEVIWQNYQAIIGVMSDIGVIGKKEKRTAGLQVSRR